ncbi:hypothetical protein [Cellulomonas sp. PhB143]|uniref:hypothetical protein n=1 Tax=Cellulomonas sp. PhB143 TaxID=2485186 RepID=UPI000F470BB8|nr:hypothetical protein [Cellulomonas sp. PhB143]
MQSVKVSAEPLKSSGKSKITVTVDFYGTSRYSIDAPDVTLESDNGYGWEYFELKATSRGDIWRGTTYVDNSNPVGKWWVGVDAWADFANGNYDYISDDYESTFYLKRSTQISLNATPEPVKKGSAISVVGTVKALKVPSYGSAYYTPFSGRTVKLYFDPTGSSPKRYAGSVTTNSHGKYSKRFTAKQDGVWSATYAGNSLYASHVSTGDFVDVR